MYLAPLFFYVNSLQLIEKYRIGFCGDWFDGEGFGRVEGSILTALELVKKFKI